MGFFDDPWNLAWINPVFWLPMAGRAALQAATKRSAPGLPNINHLQTSGYGRPLPAIWGRVRLAGNLIWAGDQGKKKGNRDEEHYVAAFMLALGEGPAEIRKNWKSPNYEFADPASHPIDILAGDPASPQTWAHLTSHHPGQALAYTGTLIAARADYDLDSSPTAPNISFEVQSARANRGYDCNQALVITDIVTDPLVGAGLPASFLADLTNVEAYCDAATFWISGALTEQKSALEHLRGILDACNCEMIWSDGRLKVIPYGDTALDNGVGNTWTPDLTPVYLFEADDFIVDSPDEDPVRVERKPESECYNVVPVQFTDLRRKYEETTVESADTADVALTGQTRRGSLVSLPWIVGPGAAQQMSRMLAQRACWIRNTYTLRVCWRAVLLEPMDWFSVNDERFGLANKLLRVIAIDHEPDETFTITAEEWPEGVAGAPIYDPQSPDGDDTNRDQVPALCEPPVVIPVPALLAGQNPAIWLAVTGTDAIYGGCDVWLSADGTVYSPAGSIAGRTRYGALTGTLPVGDPLDDTNTLAVDLTAARGILSSTSAQGRDDLETLAIVGEELLAFRTATVHTDGTYLWDLTSLRRGAWGTAIAEHAAGAVFVDTRTALRIALPQQRFDPGDNSVPLYVKVVPFNVYGGGRRKLADVPAYTFYVRRQGQLAPSAVALAVTATVPPPKTNQWREASVENLHGRLAVVSWTFLDPYSP